MQNQQHETEPLENREGLSISLDLLKYSEVKVSATLPERLKRLGKQDLERRCQGWV